MVECTTVLSKGQTVIIATTLLILGCTSSGPEPNQSNRPKVVATSSILCDLTQQIAAQTIELTCLVKPGVDPHAYALTPSDRKSLEAAQLILYNGYGLQPSLEKTIQATSADITKIAVAEQAVPDPLPSTGHHPNDDADSEHGQKGDEHNASETNSGKKTPIHMYGTTLNCAYRWLQYLSGVLLNSYLSKPMPMLKHRSRLLLS